MTDSIVFSCSSTLRLGSLSRASRLARISPTIFSTMLHTLSMILRCWSFCEFVVTVTGSS